MNRLQVWEIRGAELTISPVHKAAAGMVDSVKGLSMRFPRFIRCRDDKTIEEASTAAQIADMFRQQVRLGVWPVGARQGLVADEQRATQGVGCLTALASRLKHVLRRSHGGFSTR